MLSKNPRIKGLDGNEKMGKSLGNALYLADSDDVIAKKIMSAVTDPNKLKKDDPANPDKCMVYYYHNLITNDTGTICKECKAGSRGCVQCKKELIANLTEFLTPIREKRKYYEENIEIVHDILKKGSNKAKLKAENVIKRVKENMKINYFK